jgi:hypothetical protein
MRLYFDKLRYACKPLDPNLIGTSLDDGPYRGLFAESLLTADQLVIPIQGIALEVPTLIRWLGVKDFEGLVDHGMIQFTYSPGFPVYISVEVKRDLRLEAGPGLEIFENIGPEDKTIDPKSFYSSVEYALREQTNLAGTEVSYFSKLLSDSELKHNVSRIQEISLEESVRDGIGQLGEKLGLSKFGDPALGMLPQNLHLKYLRLAMANQALILSSTLECQELISDPITQSVAKAKMRTQAQLLGASLEGFRAIQEFENIPDVGAMAASEQVSFSDILKLRNTPASRNFRTLLGNIHSESPVGYIREYTAEVERNLGRNDLLTKHQKFAFYTLLTIGTSPLPPEVSIPLAVGVSAFDTYMSSYIRKGWSPREYIIEIGDLPQTR